MRNALELLQQKELDLVRIRKETEALRIVAHLLCDDRDELAYTEKEKGEQFHLEATGTDGVLFSANVSSSSEYEISCEQPFLVPKSTKSDSSLWQWLREKKRTVLASVHGRARRGRYGAAAGMLES